MLFLLTFFNYLANYKKYIQLKYFPAFHEQNHRLADFRGCSFAPQPTPCASHNRLKNASLYVKKFNQCFVINK